MSYLTREKANRVHQDIEKALAFVGEKHGIKISAPRMGYDNVSFRLNVRGKVLEDDGVSTTTADLRYWSQYCQRFGLESGDYGKQLSVPRIGRCTIVKIRPRSRKYPVVVRVATGKQYCVSADSIKIAKTTTTSRPIPATPTGEISTTQMKEFENLASRLSPENLTCDGELSTKRVNQRRREIMAVWHQLEQQVGRTVTEEEVWDAAISARENTPTRGDRS